MQRSKKFSIARILWVVSTFALAACRCGHLQQPTHARSQYSQYSSNRNTLKLNSCFIDVVAMPIYHSKRKLKVLAHTQPSGSHLRNYMHSSIQTQAETLKLALQPRNQRNVYALRNPTDRHIYLTPNHKTGFDCGCVFNIHCSSNWYWRARLCCVRGLSLELTCLCVDRNSYVFVIALVYVEVAAETIRV